jgi:hypothetical protein
MGAFKLCPFGLGSAVFAEFLRLYRAAVRSANGATFVGAEP